MSWVFEQSLSEGTDRLVLLAIADQARKDGTNAYPSIESIAEMANVSARTVQRAIRNLIDLGELRVERNAGGARDLRDDRRPNRYTVLMHGATAVSPRTDAERARAARSRSYRAETDGATIVSPRDGTAARHVCHPVDGHGVTTDGHGVTTEASRGDNQRAHGVTQVSPDPREDPREDPKDPNSFGVAAFGDAADDEPDHGDALLVDDELADEVEVVDTTDVTELAVAADAPATRPPRRRDELWEALLGACGISGPIPASARGAYNRAVADLRDLGVTPADIRARARVFRLRWPSASLTPTALARRWAECEPNPAHLPGRQLTRAEAALVRLVEGLA